MHVQQLLSILNFEFKDDFSAALMPPFNTDISTFRRKPVRPYSAEKSVQISDAYYDV